MSIEAPPFGNEGEPAVDTMTSSDMSVPSGGPEPDSAVTPSFANHLAAFADRGSVRSIGAVIAAFVVFALLLLARGSNPVDGYRAMWDTVTRDADSVGDVLVRMTPYLLAALAVAVPARAGLFNIGGEGQMLVGAVGAAATAFALDGSAPRGLTLVLMAVGAIALAAAWAGIAAALRLWTGTNEAISTLLLNYLALLLLNWLVFGRWKDDAAAGFPRTRLLDDGERLPVIWGRLHVGFVLALVVAVALYAVLRYTAWGFRLGVLGGNAEAARRAGFRTSALAGSALLVGGGLAGLGGFTQVAGVEGQLSPGIMSGYGFTGVLAAWMVRHHPLRAIVSSFVLAAIAIGGTGLKIREGLSAASINILMALLLLAVLGWGTSRGTKSAAART